MNAVDSANIDISYLKNIRFKNPIVLMAEDVSSNRQVVKEYLLKYNITIHETENGEDCINEARRNRLDLILMDMQMPIMDGYTAISILKSDNYLKHIPIIALTASGMKQDKDKLGNIANDFLLKPIFKYELLELLVKYLPYEHVIQDDKKDNPFVEMLTPLVKIENLSLEIRSELTRNVLPKVIRLQKSLNIDELINFENILEQYALKNSISQIEEYCAKLKDNIATFNVDKIYSTLKLLNTYIDN